MKRERNIEAGIPASQQRLGGACGDTRVQRGWLYTKVRKRKNEGDELHYFAVSYKYSFPLADESGGLALQAVSCVKSANERPLQSRRERVSFSLSSVFIAAEKGGRDSEREKERTRGKGAIKGVRCSSLLPHPGVIPHGNRAAR